jgi:hypothetical protein
MFTLAKAYSWQTGGHGTVQQGQGREDGFGPHRRQAMQRTPPEDEPEPPAAAAAAARGIVLAVLLSSVIWIGLALTL